MMLAIASFRAQEGRTLLEVSRAVDDYCSSARTAAETAVLIGAMLEDDLLLVRSSIENLQREMGLVRRAGLEGDPVGLFVEVDVDRMAQVVLARLRKGIGQMEFENDKDTERAIG